MRKLTRLTDLISDSIRWKDFISSTASGLQIHLMVVCPDGSEVSAACPVCGQLYQILSPQNQKEILTKVKNGLVKIQTESGTLVVALQLKRDGVLIVTGCPSCSQSDDQLVNKALICRKLLDSFQGSLYEEMKGGQRAVELSTLRQMNHIILSQFRGNKNALEHSFDLILSALIILLDARGSWLSLDNSPVPKQLVKGDHEQVNNYIKNPQIDTGLSVKVDSRNVRGSLGVIGPLDLEKAKKLLPLMADECLIVLEIEHLFELINRQLSRVFGTIDSAILITDAATIISYANPGFEKLTGHQVVQMIGQELGQFPAPWNKFIKNRPKNNLHGIMDVILDTEGRKRYVNWDSSPLLEDEVLFGWLIIKRIIIIGRRL